MDFEENWVFLVVGFSVWGNVFQADDGLWFKKIYI